MYEAGAGADTWVDRFEAVLSTYASPGADVCRG